MARSMTEDAVRDLAREALGLVDSEIARAGVGQLTTFNQLGFPGVADKPDGWYLPNNKNEVAVVLETKATRITLGQAQVDEVLKNVRIMQTQYKKVVGILYNGEDIRVFKGEEEVKTPTKLLNRTRLCGQHKKPPCRILSFKRSGAATAVPLPFLFGCVRGYRSKYTCRSVRLLLGASLACGGRCTLFSEWRRNFLPWHCHKDFLSLTWTALCRKIVLA